MDRLTPQDMKDAITQSVPLQRQGSILDIANTTVFLFSEAANWINGQIIVRLSFPKLFGNRVGADWLVGWLECTGGGRRIDAYGWPGFAVPRKRPAS